MALSVELYKDFGGFVLDVAFEMENETLALLGGSGCGKSMTLRCIAGIVKPDRGRIVLDGQTLFDSEKHIDLPPQKRHVGLLFQNYALFPNMTVEQNILCGMADNAPKAEKRRRAREMMSRLYLDGLEKRRPAQLSGGQQQRVALARILVSEPKILMLDEPFSALDSYLRWELEREVMKVIADFGGPTLLVSHNRDEVYRISDRIAVYRDGRIDAMDEKHGLFEDPHTYTAALLSGCKNFSAVTPNGERLDAADWGLTLTATLPTDRAVHYVGIRSHDITPATALGENTFRYEIVQQIEDVFNMVLMIRPAGSHATGLLRWELPKQTWESIRDWEPLVQLPKEKLLVLA
jgi:molybdate transport system ATP-binding protein